MGTLISTLCICLGALIYGLVNSIKEKDLEGKKFFRPEEQYRFPEGDFWMCIKRDIFDFVIHCEKEGNSLINRAVFFEE